MSDPPSTTATSPLLALPAELLQHVLSYLPPLSLTSAAQACKQLNIHSNDDQLWGPLVSTAAGQYISTPSPLPTFRDLYIAHHPHWFIPHNRIWFSDAEPYGKLIVAKYDERRQCIEAYAVSATKGPPSWTPWERNREVTIHSFEPRVALDLNQPVLKLDHDSQRTPSTTPTNPYTSEVLMQTFNNPGIHSSLQFCRNLPQAAIGPQTAVWPPQNLPSTSRTRNASNSNFKTQAHRPSGPRELSTQTFRLRKWAQYSGRHASTFSSPFASRYMNGNGDEGEDENAAETHFSHWANALGLATLTRASAGGGGRLGTGGVSLHIPESVSTFATLGPEVLQPTARKPWQGIWVGDYSGHGCEFLVVVQPDPEEERPLPKGLGWLGAYFRGQGQGARFEEGGESESEENGEGDEDGEGEDSDGWASAFEQPAGVEGRAASNNNFASRALAGIEALIRPQPGGGHTTAGVAGPSATAEVADTPYDSEDDYTTPANEPTPSVAAAEEPPTTTPLPPPPDQGSDSEPSGRLEAIKLTGDPNIPRGEYTFIAPDIGPGGFERIADEKIFHGARVVRSCGHIAGRGFRDDQYTPSQLIMISHERLAQYWEGFGHISFYQRVDLERLVGTM